MEYQLNGTALNAGQAAKNSASDAANTVRSASFDAAKQLRSSASKAADQVQQAGDATKTYAKNAVDAAGRKVDDVISQLASAKANATEYINDDPLRAVKMLAIGSAVLSAALVMLTRHSR